MPTEKTHKTIVFLHPDLGIGGAERLVVDAAVGLQNRGHKVVIFTSHCDPKHCFDEARDGTLDVRVRGNTIFPPSIASRFSIVCAILRQLHLIAQTYLSGEMRALLPDAIFVDQLSAGLPLLRYFYPSSPILFYCHFPDLLLVQGRQKWLKRLYRLPFDMWEQWSMRFADTIAVNSRFTKGIVSRTWPSLAKQKDFKIVYPCISVDKDKGAKENSTTEATAEDGQMWKGKRILLSINRFERKKDVALAIKAYAQLPKKARDGVRLVIAGGYDNRVSENVKYHEELVDLADSLGLRNATTRTLVTALSVPDDVEVLFLLSVPNALKDMLLHRARLLVYTPSNEHFGIVPLEAMLAGVPVLAANTGGPTETVVEGVTGWLRDPTDVRQWADVMDLVLTCMSDKELTALGREGMRRVKDNFACERMAERLDSLFDEILGKPRSSFGHALALGLFGLLALLGVLASTALVRASRQ
ncbi:hypothetical protein VTK73DRAFT_3314 [Phialemonium thermophilum]|uniref:Alpha-1,3/1,6-mannosyltransferase ALG2 n=1 Tax=Phialemonium thermophilum TaxID=223376 RepID=A0ABR3Y1Y0_9PEZI